MPNRRILSFFIFLFFFGIYSLFMSGHLYSPDEEIMFRTTESMVMMKGFAIQPIAAEGDRFTATGNAGKYFGHYGLGQSILALPFYWAGTHLAYILPPDFQKGFRPDTITYYDRSWQNTIARFAVSRFHQILTALTCVLLFNLVLAMGYMPLTAFLLCLIYGLTSIAFPFAKTFYSEPTVTFLILLTLYNFYRYRQTGRLSLLAWAGTAYGFAVLTRMDSVILAPVLTLYLCLINYPESTAIDIPQSLKRLIIFGLPGLGFLLLMGLYNYVRFGSLTYTGYESEGLTFSASMLDGLYGMLMSSGKSIFIYSPAILLFFPAIRSFWNEHREEAVFCCGLALSYLLFYSKWESWAGGWTWGSRHVFQIHLFLLIPVLALLEKHLKKPSYLFWIPTGLLCLIGIIVQIPGVLVSFMDYHYWFQFQAPLHEIIYIPVHSTLAGQWNMMYPENIDLFYYQLWISNASWGIRYFFLIPVVLILGSGYYIVKSICPLKSDKAK